MEKVPNAHWWSRYWWYYNWSRGIKIEFVDPYSTYIYDRRTTHIQTGTRINPSTFLRGEVRIGEKCVIGPLVIIVDSTIGNNTLVVDGAKIKRASVGNNTKIPHECYLADIIIGDEVNIGHGSATSNFDGLEKQKTKIGSRTFVGTFVDFIAPVEIGEECFIASRTRVSSRIPISPHSFVYERTDEKGFSRTIWRDNCAFRSPHYWKWVWTKEPINPDRMRELWSVLDEEIGDYRMWLICENPELGNSTPRDILKNEGEKGIERLYAALEKTHDFQRMEEK